MLCDSVPEVRASVMYALGTFLGDPNKTDYLMNIEHNVAIACLVAMSDGSPIVRKELVIALSNIVHQAGPSNFLVAASQTIDEEQAQRSGNTNGNTKSRISSPTNRSVSAALAEWRTNSNSHSGSTSHESVYAVIWKALLNLSVDPHPDIAKAAATVVDHINGILLDTPSVGDYVALVVRESLENQTNEGSTVSTIGHTESTGLQTPPYLNDLFTSAPSSTSASSVARPAKLTRSVSFASTLRTIYNFGNTSSVEEIAATESGNENNTTSQRLRPRSNLAMTSSTLQHNNNRPNSASYSNNITTDTKSNMHSNNADNVLPSSSEFYDWSCEYFTEPQMRVSTKMETKKGIGKEIKMIGTHIFVCFIYYIGCRIG
jgi:regulator-associated protein of mTOR